MAERIINQNTHDEINQGETLWRLEKLSCYNDNLMQYSEFWSVDSNYVFPSDPDFLTFPVTQISDIGKMQATITVS